MNDQIKLLVRATLAVIAGLILAGSATAQTAAQPASAPTTRTAPRTILFIGNSFTFGAYSPVREWQPSLVHDLNNTNIGGVPALFKKFTLQAGLNYDVSLETQGGTDLGFHVRERSRLFDRPWDVVLLQTYSTIDRENPGDPANYIRDAAILDTMFHKQNALVDVFLTSSWSRADQVYLASGHWHGTPIETMARDVRAAADAVRKANPTIKGVIPVGEAWNRAFVNGIADPNPYDGLTFGQVDLWSYDHYHASAFGYYLEALVIFGKVSGLDARTLGRDEQAAASLGISPDIAVALQEIAYQELIKQERQ